MKRILFASLPVGGGHLALRDSLRTALALGAPGTEPFEPHTFDSQDTRLRGIYEFCVHRAPWLQRLQYSVTDLRATLPLLASTTPVLQAEVQAELARVRPDAVVATHFLLSALFVRARKRLGLDVPVVNAIPDYGEPVEVFAPRGAHRLEGIIVMAPHVRERLLERGTYPASRVHLSGFLPREPFQRVGREIGAAPRLSRERRAALLESVRQEYPEARGLDATRPTVVFLGGSAWTEKTGPVLERLLRTPSLHERLNVVVVCGGNARFHETLTARVAALPHVVPFGFVDAHLLARLMAVADVPVLGSLAPATLHELMETRCGPLLLFHVIPGSEDSHPEYIVEQELGLFEPHPDAMLDLVAQATGLLPPGPRVAPLQGVCAERMRALREENVERARHLGGFLLRLMGQETGPWAPHPATAQDFG
ncbi:hypothetical protein [Archangium primigenium]|uniref:hypothetical protein n=1 Tax=[Archangium] primigenium TaxID=2792470 RepID=UPI001956EF53|nr:hypothetical protein [Archangium primigenium]MBM7119033.1 hypothetical protein [Archangium primigenium]